MYARTRSRRGLGDGTLPVVTGVAVQYNGTATAPLATPGTVIGIDPANPANYLVAGAPGFPPYSIPQMFSGESTLQPGYAQSAALDQATYPGTFFQVAPGQYSGNAQAAAPLTMADLITLLGTAAGVGFDGTSPFVTINGVRYTLNSDGQTFAGSDGHTYALADVQDALTAAQTPVVTQQVAPTPISARPPNGWNAGSYQGVAGYWGPNGLFYSGTAPWTNANAVGISIDTAVAVQNAAQTGSVPTNPDGTPTYNGQPYSATDANNPYNEPGYIPSGAVGPATPGGGMSAPGALQTTPAGTTPVAVAGSSVASAVSGIPTWAILLGAAGAAYLLLRRRPSPGVPTP